MSPNTRPFPLGRARIHRLDHDEQHRDIRGTMPADLQAFLRLRIGSEDDEDQEPRAARTIRIFPMPA